MKKSEKRLALILIIIGVVIFAGYFGLRNLSIVGNEPSVSHSVTSSQQNNYLVTVVPNPSGVFFADPSIPYGSQTPDPSQGLTGFISGGLVTASDSYFNNVNGGSSLMQNLNYPISSINLNGFIAQDIRGNDTGTVTVNNFTGTCSPFGTNDLPTYCPNSNDYHDHCYKLGFNCLFSANFKVTNSQGQDITPYARITRGTSIVLEVNTLSPGVQCTPNQLVNCGANFQCSNNQCVQQISMPPIVPAQKISANNTQIVTQSDVNLVQTSIVNLNLSTVPPAQILSNSSSVSQISQSTGFSQEKVTFILQNANVNQSQNQTNPAVYIVGIIIIAGALGFLYWKRNRFK